MDHGCNGTPDKFIDLKLKIFIFLLAFSLYQKY